MLKNDYRRALIMMRSFRQGLSGYVRLERRTLMGTMQFTVNGATADQALFALLLYRLNGLWYALRLDRLGEERYGQAGLVYKFDPRNIGGRTLEQYSLVAVASVQDGVCALALSGNLNGSVEADWDQIRQAVCMTFSSACSSDRPVEPEDSGETEEPTPIPRIAAPSDSDEPETFGEEDAPCACESEDGDDAAVVSLLAWDGAPGENDRSEDSGAEPDQPDVSGEPAEGEAVPVNETLSPRERDEESAPSQPDEPAEEAPAGTGPDELDTPAEESPAGTEPDELDTPAEETPGGTEPDELDTPAEEAPAGTEPDELDTPAEEALDGTGPDEPHAPSKTPRRHPAAEELALDIGRPWPECVEPLRPLFSSRVSCRPFEAEGFVLIRAPIAPETGLDHCIAGISCADGKPNRVLYGIPARFTPEPPPGLEGYEWRGDLTGGYWVIVRPVC